MAELQKLNLKQLTAKQDDPLGIQLFDTDTRPFWIKKNGTDPDGQHLLAFVIAEQQWISEAAPDCSVRKTDVVLDIGAYIGTFGDDALRRGATKAIVVELDPVNVE